jgi:general secretion pathway protein C
VADNRLNASKYNELKRSPLFKQHDELMNYPDWVGQAIYLEKRQQLALMTAIALVGLISLGHQAINLKHLISSTSTAAPSQSTPTHPKPIPPVIAAVPLFGTAGANDPAVTQNLPTTNLQLTLRGAVVESDAAKSSAVIEEPGKPAQSYRIGETLPGGATLDAVFADHVVLKRNGELETLNFPATDTLNIRQENSAPNTPVTMPVSNVPKSGPSAMHHQGTAPTPVNISPHSIQERLQQLQQQHGQR